MTRSTRSKASHAAMAAGLAAFGWALVFLLGDSLLRILEDPLIAAVVLGVMLVTVFAMVRPARIEGRLF